MIRSALFKIWTFGTMTALGVLFLPAFFLPHGATAFGIRMWARGVRGALLVIYGVRTEIRGLERLPGEPALVAAKHQSLYDTIVTFLFLKDPVTVMKRELLRAPVFGAYAQKVGSIAIDRDAGPSALKAMTKSAAAGLEAGRAVVIFPEGPRTDPGAPPDYKVGVYALYRGLGAACVPVATNSGVFWPSKGVRPKAGVCVYEILPALPSGLDRRDFMTRLQNEIEGASNALLEPEVRKAA